MKSWKFTFVIAALAVLIVGILANTYVLQPVDMDQSITEQDFKVGKLPANRPFHMGFTYQPYDWSKDAFAQTAGLIAKHGDFIAIIDDTGIPWPEAFEGKPYHPNVEHKLQRNMTAIRPHQTVAVVASALGTDRLSLAAYAGEIDPMERPGVWASRHFDSPKVLKAYLQYANDLISRFKPRYFCYLAEANAAHTDAASPQFLSLKRFAEKAYTALKSVNPDVKICIEFLIGNAAHVAEREAVIAALLPYTDIFAISTYPFHEDGIAGDARKIPADWFTRARDQAGGKPFAILETAFAAENLMHPTLGIKITGQDQRLLIPGGPKSQAVYIKRLLEEANALNALFVNLWAIHDLDRLSETVGRADDDDTNPLWLLPQDSGLYDENGRARPSLKVWQQWFSLPKK